jgi:OOP family OmpA-OmpF porin
VNIKQVISLTGLIAAAAGISPLALAQDSGWYLGASAGQAKVKDLCPSSLPVGSSCDDNSGAYGVFAGYKANKFLGAELGYAYLGETNASASGITNTVKAQGVELLGVGAIPFNPHFEIYGKVGVFFWDRKDSCAGTSCVFGSQSGTGSDLTYALGAQFNFSRYYGMRFQYQRYQNVGDENTTGKNDVDVLSVSVLFRF